MAFLEWLIAGGVLLLVGTATLFSLWRFEKNEAERLRHELTQRQTELEALRQRDQAAQRQLARDQADIAQLQTQLDALQQREQRWQTLMQAHARQEGEMNRLQQQLAQSERQREMLTEELRQRQDRLAEQLQENEHLRTRLQEQARRHEAELKLLTEARTQLAEAFENLSARIFDKTQQQFQRQSRQQLESMVRPWQEQLAQFRKRVDELHMQQSQQIGILQGELKQLRQLNETLSQEAEALVRALRQDSKMQGNWGEQILSRLLEAAGLREGHEFEREAAFDGGRQRIDVLIHLPEGHSLIIDAKVSLKAYVTAVNAENESIRRQAVQAHLDSVRKHIDTLGRKAYHLNDRLLTPEFTLMFIPVEGAYLLALENDPHLHEYAYRRGVALATPPTLLTTLKTVAHLWRLARQDRDVAELLRLAGTLHDKFVGFSEAFDQLAHHLDQADKAWHTAQGRLLDGRGNVVSVIHRIGALSGKIRKKLPDDWENRALGEATFSGDDSTAAKSDDT